MAERPPDDEESAHDVPATADCISDTSIPESTTMPNPSSWMLLLCCVCCTMPVSAAITIEGTRIVHDATRNRDVMVRTLNRGGQPALAQVWIDAGVADAPLERLNLPFRLTPAEPRLIRPHEGQVYRITYAPRPGDASLPADRESIFYFNLLDVPPRPKDSAERNVLQFAVRTRLKLFHRPAGLPGKPIDAADALRWHVRDGALQVCNPTAFHVSVNRLTLEDGTAVEMDMVQPRQYQSIALPAGHPMPGTVHLQWINDDGAVQELKASVGAPPVNGEFCA